MTEPVKTAGQNVSVTPHIGATAGYDARYGADYGLKGGVKIEKNKMSYELGAQLGNTVGANAKATVSLPMAQKLSSEFSVFGDVGYNNNSQCSASQEINITTKNGQEKYDYNSNSVIGYKGGLSQRFAYTTEKVKVAAGLDVGYMGTQFTNFKGKEDFNTVRKTVNEATGKEILAKNYLQSGMNLSSVYGTPAIEVEYKPIKNLSLEAKANLQEAKVGIKYIF